ncbi:hypothetical protein [Paraoerskovia marina]|uniref:hypothetical protein n=1 Tax=Paraoerskovia marina TaxID=545619 RepID=UPI0004923166|nr:hypothetical protein [Paraoerskovia marina]
MTETAPTTPEAPRRRQGMSTATVVWGVVVTLVAVGAISLALGASFDLGLALIVALTAGGVALLVGAVAGAAGRRRSRTKTD